MKIATLKDDKHKEGFVEAEKLLQPIYEQLEHNVKALLSINDEITTLEKNLENTTEQVKSHLLEKLEEYNKTSEAKSVGILDIVTTANTDFEEQIKSLKENLDFLNKEAEEKSEAFESKISKTVLEEDFEKVIQNVNSLLTDLDKKVVNLETSLQQFVEENKKETEEKIQKNYEIHKKDSEESNKVFNSNIEKLEEKIEKQVKILTTDISDNTEEFKVQKALNDSLWENINEAKKQIKNSTQKQEELEKEMKEFFESKLQEIVKELKTKLKSDDYALHQEINEQNLKDVEARILEKIESIDFDEFLKLNTFDSKFSALEKNIESKLTLLSNVEKDFQRQLNESVDTINKKIKVNLDELTRKANYINTSGSRMLEKQVIPGAIRYDAESDTYRKCTKRGWEDL